MTAASSTSAVTTFLRRAAVTLQAHAVVDRGDHEPAEHGVDRFAAAAEEARPADDRGRDRVEHERAAVERVDTDRRRDAYTMPAMPAVNDAERERRACGSSPGSCRRGGRPRDCRRWRTCSARTWSGRGATSTSSSTPSTISTTHGTPLIGTSVPRLVLQISTSTTPAAAAPAIFSSVTLAGGATRPLVRRRDSCSHRSHAEEADDRIMTIQLASRCQVAARDVVDARCC